MVLDSQKGDYIKIGAISFVVLFGLIYLIDQFVPEISISLGPVIWLVLIAIAGYVALRFMKLERDMDWSKGVVFAGILVGVIWLLLKYPSISPNFASIARLTMSLVGAP